MILELINVFVGALVPLCLIFVGIYFSFKLKFFWIFHPFKLIGSMLRKRGERQDGASPFRAVTVALAGTLGVGNIIGVASAVSIGGPGAVFWMWVSALFAMVLKYAEITLSVSHRRLSKSGFFGGAVYYIRDLFDSKGFYSLGKAFALIFSVFLLLNGFSTGSVVQINAAARSAYGVFGISPIFVGVSAAIITFFVVIRGANGVGKLTERLIPALTLAYIFLSLVVMIKNCDALPYALLSIFKSAFNSESVGGGVFGFITSKALRFGAMRGLLSNEAGCGTAPTAHAAADAKSPAEQGFWGIFEVFVDTVLLCTLTAAVIIINYDKAEHLGADPIMMAIKAYSASLGAWSEYLLAGAVAVFGIATVICWAHYGAESIRYLFPKKHKIFSFLYLILYACVTAAGAVAAPNSVWGVADLSLGALTLMNTFILILCRKEISRHTTRFFDGVS